MPCVTDTGVTAADGGSVSGQRGNKQTNGRRKQLPFKVEFLKAVTQRRKYLQCGHCVFIQLFDSWLFTIKCYLVVKELMIYKKIKYPQPAVGFQSVGFKVVVYRSYELFRLSADTRMTFNNFNTGLDYSMLIIHSSVCTDMYDVKY